MVLVQSILLGLIAFIGNHDYALGTNMISRPIVLGPLVGIALGDVQQGVILGATLELFFLGAVSVGAYLPPNVLVGGVLGTAFAISLNKGTEVAITLAFPIALLVTAIQNVILSVIMPMIAQIADRYAKKGSYRGVEFIHIIIGMSTCLISGIIVFLGYYIGSNRIENFVNKIPKVITDGLGIATGLLPALGFAMLAKMIMNKNVIPYFFLGFVLSSYMKIPVSGIAIIGLIIIFTKFNFKFDDRVSEVQEVDNNDF